MICSFNILIFLAVCLNVSTVINIKILTNSNQQTQSYKFTSHIAAFLSMVLITEMLEICIQTSYDQKRSTDFKESSSCSVWYPLNGGKKKSLRSNICHQVLKDKNYKLKCAKNTNKQKPWPYSYQRYFLENFYDKISNLHVQKMN